ncbi:MAG TPA: GNAT family protein [Planctomycetota bacterium]|nr:GNAT family protein [Planctomycetota bacterium]
MKNAFVIGERIYFRPFEKADAPTLTGFINDPAVRRTLEWHRPMNIHTEEAWIAEHNKSEDELILGIALKENDELIGSVGLHKISARDRKATFGLLIGVKDEWNKGYGTEATRLMLRHAFVELNLNRVALHVYESNPGGVRAYEKAGFVLEGRLRQCAFRDGRYVDVLCMSVLREEWLQSKVEGRKAKADERVEFGVLTEV